VQIELSPNLTLNCILQQIKEKAIVEKQKFLRISATNEYKKFSFTKCGSRRHFPGSLAIFVS
jgi:hypothetical protein